MGGPSFLRYAGPDQDRAVGSSDRFENHEPRHGPASFIIAACVGDDVDNRCLERIFILGHDAHDFWGGKLAGLSRDRDEFDFAIANQAELHHALERTLPVNEEPDPPHAFPFFLVRIERQGPPLVPDKSIQLGKIKMSGLTRVSSLGLWRRHG